MTLKNVTLKKLTLKKVSEEVHRKLKMKAAEEGMFLQDYIVKLLEEATATTSIKSLDKARK